MALEKRFLLISGMTCAACSGTVEKCLKLSEGVFSAKVSLLTNRAEVIFDSRIISIDEVCENIEDVGFGAKAVQSPPSSNACTFALPDLDFDDTESLKRSILDLEGVIEVTLSYEEGDRRARITFDPLFSGPRTILRSVSQMGIAGLRFMPDDGLTQKHTQMKQMEQADSEEWLRLLKIALVFTIPVFLIQLFFPVFIPSLSRVLNTTMQNSLSLQTVLLFLLVTPVQFYVGSRFYVGSFKSLRQGRANMDVLVAVGTSAAYVYSVISMILALNLSNYHGEQFFETCAFLITIILFGKYLENSAKSQTSDSLKTLMGLQPKSATVVILDTNNKIIESEDIDRSLLQINDIVMVRSGCSIPTDGIVVYGSGRVDESLLSGESLPLEKDMDDRVIGATVVVEGCLFVRAEVVGSDTVLSQIVNLVEEAQTNKAPIQQYADRIASIFVPCITLIALLTWIIWFTLLEIGTVPSSWKPEGMDNFLFAFLFAVATIVVSCPCALGLATPTAVMVATGVGARLGILFKGGEPLEVAGKVNVVCFDKTGTLTKGCPAVRSVDEVSDSIFSYETLWSLVVSVEHRSEHILGKAIYAHGIAKKDVFIKECVNFDAKSGAGVYGEVDGYQVAIGNRKWVEFHGCGYSPEIDGKMKDVEGLGRTAVAVAVDRVIYLVIGIGDALKPDAADTIAALHYLGIDTWMVTGDNALTADVIAGQAGIPAEFVLAEVLPADKVDLVKRLQSRGNIVAFVGDGVNDSPALAQANVGIAMGHGTDVAIESADVVLMRSPVSDVVVTIDLSQATIARIQWNLLWAFVYNILGIPFAAGVFFPLIHVMLPPSMAGIAMGFSSVSVVLSSLVLKTYTRPSLEDIQTRKRRKLSQFADRVQRLGIRRAMSYTRVGSFPGLSPLQKETSLELSEV